MDSQGKKLIISILLNIIITALQAFYASISGSLSLLTDALHNFSDVISLVVSYIANKLSTKKSSEKIKRRAPREVSFHKSFLQGD